MENPFKYGEIVKKLRFIGDTGENEVTALLDSGAGSSLIRKDVLKSIGGKSFARSIPRVFTMANGKESLISDKMSIVVIEMKGKLLDGVFYITNELSREAIIGVDFMQKWEIKLDLKNEDYSIGVDPQHIEIAEL